MKFQSFVKSEKKKFFLSPWQGADGSEDAFMGTRVTRDRVSDNLESMIIFHYQVCDAILVVQPL